MSFPNLTCSFVGIPLITAKRGIQSSIESTRCVQHSSDSCQVNAKDSFGEEQRTALIENRLPTQYAAHHSKRRDGPGILIVPQCGF